MSLKLKYFTVEEAESLIPKITEVLVAALETKAQIERKVDSWRKVHKSVGEAEEAVLRGQVDFLASHLETQLGQITELGCVPKDLDMGLVDFPARIDSKEAFLCWKMGETKIKYWHGLTEGFPGRRPLKREG
jgi:hypothetical protein